MQRGTPGILTLRLIRKCSPGDDGFRESLDFGDFGLSSTAARWLT
jgi:hypothetical protein